MSYVPKPARKQGRNANVGGSVLAYVRALGKLANMTKASVTMKSTI